jgi:hemerythrin-like domain-containing protein
VTEGEKTRLVAWNHELRAVHERLREALDVTRAALDEGDAAASATRELLLFCHGFCAALTGHHESEDQVLFPAIATEHPELSDTLRTLARDHSMIAHLLAGLQAAVEEAAPRSELDQQLAGIAAIMESHFRYEERQLLAVLDVLGLTARPTEVLGRVEMVVPDGRAGADSPW